MSTHDYVLSNQVGSDARVDLNLLFQAIVSQNSSATEPATTYPYMIWMDTSTNTLKMRNAANTSWGYHNKGYPINYNGNMQIAQAGTSFAAPASLAYDIDGWQNVNTSAAVLTVDQVTGSVSGKYARQVTITTADASVAAGDILTDSHIVEGYDISQLVGKDFTVSFTAKFPVTGIHCVTLRNYGINRSYVHEINCVAANTYADYSFTVVGGLPSTGTWAYTNGIGLYFNMQHMAGTTFTGTPATADTWMTGNYMTTANQVNDCATIGNVWAMEEFRIDLGTVKGTEWPSYQENLARCQRYYRTVKLAIAASTDNTSSTLLSTSMRDVPTITGGGAGFTSTGTTNEALLCYQTARANVTLTLASRL